MPFNPYNMPLDPRDPRVQALLMQQRMQGAQSPGQMPPQLQGPPPVAGQVGGMGGPGPQPPMQAPGGTPQGMPPSGGPPMGGGQLDPAMIDQVLALQGQGSQRAGLDRQYKLAEALRADAKGQLQGTRVPSSTGGIYVAPNWANGLVSVAGNIMADRKQAAADTAGAGLDAQRQAAAKRYLSALSSGNRPRKKPEEEDIEGGY